MKVRSFNTASEGEKPKALGQGMFVWTGLESWIGFASELKNGLCSQVWSFGLRTFSPAAGYYTFVVGVAPGWVDGHVHRKQRQRACDVCSKNEKTAETRLEVLWSPRGRRGRRIWLLQRLG